MSLTTDPNSECLKEGKQEKGQNACYLVLSPEEIAKGFVRPVRTKYVHVGKKVERDNEGRIIGRLIKIDEPDYDNANNYFTKEKGYGGYIAYPEGHTGTSAVGRYLKIEEVEAIVARKKHFGGCGVETRMNETISETYARDPKFYGATFCVGCNKHLPVEEFEWSVDGEIVGS